MRGQPKTDQERHPLGEGRGSPISTSSASSEDDLGMKEGQESIGDRMGHSSYLGLPQREEQCPFVSQLCFLVLSAPFV